ncbi:MAG: chemotaxis protein CheD [Candidatus Omnitrophica bacterium]|jgi:chemotaxis protein CheD|nr:chemotaxis protein CheD [Candidatus Omnitrophota bacterium]
MDKVMESTLIEVQMGKMELAQAPDRLITRGLGSCLGITFYSPVNKIGAMVHPMLPDIDKSKIKSNPSRFVNSGIILALQELEKRSCPRSLIEIKLFGGAHMFSFINTDSALNVGQKNIEMAHAILKDLNLKVIVEEVGGTFGRTIELDTETGKVLVKTVSWGEKVV